MNKGIKNIKANNYKLYYFDSSLQKMSKKID